MADNPVNSAANPADKNSEIFFFFFKLAEISHSIEQHARMQASAYNLVQAGEIKRRIDELTESQNRLVMAIVDRHPDAEARERFKALGRKIDDYRPQIKACDDREELKRLKNEIDEAVEEWVLQFQIIVSNIVGVTPPTRAVQSESPF